MSDPRSSKRAILDRIKRFDEAIAKANEYLESGKHANWSGFRPWFDRKIKDSKELPPHRDWVKNVFIPRREKELNRLERIIEELSDEKRTVRPSTRQTKKR